MLLLALCASIGCSGSGPKDATPPTTEASREAAEADLARYRQSLATGDYVAAVATGQGILRAHPGTSAAEEVEHSLNEVKTKAAAEAEQQRLAALWAYQTGTESGGAQSAASIFAKDPGPDGERMRLILRRHAEWGTSAYLYAGRAGFSCSKPCTVGLRFDDGPVERWRASKPATGEPALFIEDHERLAARIATADRLEIDVVLAERGPSSSLFEIGGFDPKRWPPLPGTFSKPGSKGHLSGTEPPRH